MNDLNNTAKRLLIRIKRNLIPFFSARLSYAQEGEDLILNRFFNGVKTGFYVDVGAYHPWRFSNTFIFYKKGWRGINIDAMPGSMKLFRFFRRRDINIEVPIHSSKKSLEYYIFTEHALNTFSPRLAQKYIHDGCTLIRKTTLPTSTLADILEKNVPPDQAIEFLTVDAEGVDLEVLQSNDWKRYKPRVILIETQERTMEKLDQQPMYQFLQEQGYVLFAKTVHTVFFSISESNSIS